MIDNSSPELAVDVSGLTRRFKGKLAVDNLSLSIPAGTVYGFIGPNGAGKSTTLRMLMGLLPIDAGRASVLGMDAGSCAQAIRRHVGYVPEQHFIYRWMRVKEVIRFCSTFYETWNHELCDQFTDQLQLPRNKKVQTLSKGMVVKLSLLLAVSHEPKLLILDEPMAGLDPLIREEFMEGILASLVTGGVTVLLSSHTLSDVQRLSDTVGIINEGRMLVQCSIDELLSRTKRIRLALEGDSPPDGLTEMGIFARTDGRECVLTVGDYSDDTVGRLIEFDGVEVIEVSDISLEEAFKDHIKGRRMQI